jgi:hypothetical protein
MVKRICPDCQARELDFRQKYCSECTQIRRDISRDLARFNWITKNPDKYRHCYLKNNKKYREGLRWQQKMS